MIGYIMKVSLVALRLYFARTKSCVILMTLIKEGLFSHEVLYGGQSAVG